MEGQAEDYFRRIDDMGGMIPAIEEGFPQQEILEASYKYQKAVEEKRKIVVGVNAFESGEPDSIQLLHIGEEAKDNQVERLTSLRRRRDSQAVSQRLQDLRTAARDRENLMPLLVEAVREYATLGEICNTLKEVFGTYAEPVF
jgi:methylmalonyl-CoA mutase N-terminal domain/subunit